MGKNMKMECKKLDSFQHSQKCAFCGTSEVNEDKLGPIYMHKNITTHYFCLLLSSNMEQNGRDSDGILGFLYNDIQKEIKRGQRLYCTYCKNKGASLGCTIRKCRTVFHLPCGLRNDSLHQFFGQFRSYCSVHRPCQEVDKDILAEARKQTGVCAICCEKIVPYPTKTTLWAPCCKKNAWFHRDCIQRMAISFGYFFKCPLCNNKDTFQEAMKHCGIYIPEQDASWEVVPNAFGELYQRHDTCDAENCTCPKGRRGNYIGTRWQLVLCSTCGSQGIHIGCGRLKWTKPEWHCPACSAVVQPKGATDRKEKHQTQINEQKKDSISRTRSSISSTNLKEDESSSSEYNSYLDDSSDEEKTTRAYYTERDHRHRQKKRLYKRSRSPSILREYTARTPFASRHRSQSPPVLRNVCTSPPRPFSPFRKSHVHKRTAHPLPCPSPPITSKSHREFSPLPNKSSAPCTSTVPTIIVDDDDDDDDDVVMIVDDSPDDDVLITKDGSRIKVIPMKENIKELKSIKAEGDPSVEEIIECNIQIKCDTSKRKGESSSVNTASYVTGLAQNKSVLENVQTVCSVEGVQTYSVPVQEYNMSSTSFAAQACIVNSDSCRQNGFLQQEVPQHPVWQDAQQKPYISASQQQRKRASSSKRSSVSIDSDISEHGAANSYNFRSSKRPRTTKPAGGTATNDKENSHSGSSSNNPKKKSYVKPRCNRNRLNPCVVLTPLKFTVTEGKVEILYKPKRKDDEVETNKKSVRNHLKFDSDLNSKQYVKLSSKENRVVHSVKSKVNKVKFEHNPNYVNSDISEAENNNRIKIKSEGKLKKRQECKTKKNKTNKILFNFFNKHKTAVHSKSKYRLTNKINASLEPRTYEKRDVTSEVIDDMKYKLQTGDSEFKSSEIFTFKKELDAKTYSTDSNVHVNRDGVKQESKLENIYMSKQSILFESTNCNRDKFSSLKEGKSGKQAIESNICLQNKKVKGNKNGRGNKEFVRAKETSKENFNHLKSVVPKVKNKGKLYSRYVIGKPSFKVKLISKGSLTNKHKKQIDKIKTDVKVKFPETKQNNDFVPDSEDSCENETSPERKTSLEYKVVTESKVSRCLCSYFKMTCNHCSGKKVITKDEPEVAKKQTKEKTSTTAESVDSSQLKLSLSSSGFCLSRVI